MTKALSNLQLTANRKNARKSTGPKSRRGKARSLLNALKHGLLAKTVVVDPAESRPDFDRLLADLVREIKPRNLIEQTLVERIATCYWRLRRAQRYESGAIRRALEAPNPDFEILDKTRRKLAEKEKDLALEQRLAHLLAREETAMTPDESRELEESFRDFARAHGLTLLNLDPLPLKREVQNRLPRILADFQAKVDSLRLDLETLERQSSLRQEQKSLDASLPAGESFLEVVRYETMLDRQIHRALAERRRLRIQVPDRVTRRKKRTCETNPFRTTASKKNS